MTLTDAASTARTSSHETGHVREEDKPSTRTAWVVLARRKYDEPLYQVGTVSADEPEMAEVYARGIYDEQPWIELVIVPRTQMRTVIAP